MSFQKPLSPPQIPSSTLDPTPSQTSVLLSLISATFPPITTDPSHTHFKLVISHAEFQSLYTAAANSRTNFPSEQDFLSFLSEDASTNPEIINGVISGITKADPEASSRILWFLWALSSRLGSLLLTGSLTPFHLQSISFRQATLASWRNSFFPQKRLFVKTITMLVNNPYVQNSYHFNHQINYTSTPSTYTPATGFPFTFEQFPPSLSPESTETLTTGVLIIGSGPGAAATAATLSSAGIPVMVVEKSYHYTPSHFPMTQSTGEYHLFENHGVISSKSGAMTIVAGSTFGGGGTINWSASLRTQDYVRKEWATQDRLPLFMPRTNAKTRYDELMDQVLETIGATEDYPRNIRGDALLEAAEKGGVKAARLMLNAGKDHDCGRCHLGCGTNSKKGPTVAWLPRAVENGAKFIEGLQVERVIIEEVDGQKVAKGVEGIWSQRQENYTRKVKIMADKVVVSAGGLWSPVILKNSGVTNPIIGKNLHLHPATMLTPRYNQEIIPWEGSIMSSIVTEFENLDGKGHGVKIEPCCSIPFVVGIGTVWRPGPTHRPSLTHLPTLSPYVLFVRESTPGSVSVHPTTGRPVVDYTPSPETAKHMVYTTVALAKLLYRTGITELRSSIPGVPFFIRADGDEGRAVKHLEDPEVVSPKFKAWLDTFRNATKAVGDASTPWFSAHQMGSCRMSGIPEKGVVNPKGKVYGVDNLYVADASILPSATGVNPMVSTMSVSLHIAYGIVKSWKISKGR